MTKEEFMGFSSEAQHNMVLEALARVTKNIEIIENESGRPFADTSKQRMNDVKLLTILADAFSKNELVWNQKTKLTRDDILERGAALNTGIEQNGKHMTLEQYVKEKIKENIKESRGKNYGKE